jgi:hypothetical protein
VTLAVLAALALALRAALPFAVARTIESPASSRLALAVLR